MRSGLLFLCVLSEGSLGLIVSVGHFAQVSLDAVQFDLHKFDDGGNGRGKRILRFIPIKL